MIRGTGIGRIGWLAFLALSAACYTILHLNANAMHAQVVRAEREIVRLEEENLLLETEFLTRSNHIQLAKLNRINFGYRAPEASQFLHGERDLARFGLPRGPDAPEPIRLARVGVGEDPPAFPEIEPQPGPGAGPRSRPGAGAEPGAVGRVAAIAARVAGEGRPEPPSRDQPAAIARIALPGADRPLAIAMASFAQDGAP